MAEQCMIYDRDCIDCGECDRCDLDETKVCDSCGRCIENDGNYRSVKVDEFRKNIEDREKLPKKK